MLRKCNFFHSMLALILALLPSVIAGSRNQNRHDNFAHPSPAFVAPSIRRSMLKQDCFSQTPKYHERLYSGPEKHQILFSAVEEEGEKEVWKVRGEELIRNAAIEAGADPSSFELSWKPGKLKVIVSGNTVMGKGKLDDESEDVDEDKDEDVDEDKDEDSPLEEEEEEENTSTDQKPRIDIVAVTRAVNVALITDEEVGLKIAETHEIEVTTPGSPDILEGPLMFEVYKGFNVFVETSQLKKNGKPKIIEGKLIERNENEVKIDIKGRLSKVKNDIVVCVRLPKAKREKKGR